MRQEKDTGEEDPFGSFNSSLHKTALALKDPSRRLTPQIFASLNAGLKGRPNALSPFIEEQDLVPGGPALRRTSTLGNPRMPNAMSIRGALPELRDPARREDVRELLDAVWGNFVQPYHEHGELAGLWCVRRGERALDLLIDEYYTRVGRVEEQVTAEFENPAEVGNAAATQAFAPQASLSSSSAFRAKQSGGGVGARFKLSSKKHHARFLELYLPVLCEFVYHFHAMHPFYDGNGRTGHAILQLELVRAGAHPAAMFGQVSKGEGRGEGILPAVIFGQMKKGGVERRYCGLWGHSGY
jgi:hypothetical protein